MSALSYLYRILDKCVVHGKAIHSDTEDQTLKLTLNDFINKNNDEDFPAQDYDFNFDKAAFQSLFKIHDEPLPEVKILMAHVEFFGRYTVESYIGYKHDTSTGDISFQLEEGCSKTFNLNHINEYDGHDVEIHDIDSFITKLDDEVSLDHHWIMVVFVDTETKQGVVPDYDFLEKYGIELD